GHLLDDVAAAHQLAADVQLRDGRPLAVDLDAFADLRVLQHVDVGELDPGCGQRAGRLGGEAALRRTRLTLHEQDDAVVVQEAFDARTQGGVELHGERSVTRGKRAV